MLVAEVCNHVDDGVHPADAGPETIPGLVWLAPLHHQPGNHEFTTGSTCLAYVSSSRPAVAHRHRDNAHVGPDGAEKLGQIRPLALE